MTALSAGYAPGSSVNKKPAQAGFFPAATD